MERAAVRSELERLFRRVLVAPDLPLHDAMETGAHPNWNSIANVEILIGCEEIWGFEFATSEIDRIRTFGDLVDAVAAKLG